MARRGMTGQLNMFDFFNSLDAGAPGEVEMVSLVPEFDEEPEEEEFPVEETAIVVEEKPIEEMIEEPQLEEESQLEEAPQMEEEPQIDEISQDDKAISVDEKVAMSRTYQVEGTQLEIAYINYNKVRITRGNGTPIIKEFTSTKEAVDYYVEQIQEYEIDE